MQAVMTWILTNWQPTVVALLAIDAALIPLFPNATIFEKIKGWLTNVAPKV